MRPATRSPLAAAAFLCLACVACRPERVEVIQEDPALAGSALSSAKVAEPAAAMVHKQDHFKHSKDLLAAVVTGNLTAARRHSKWLAQKREHEPGLAPWTTQIAQLQAVAREGMLTTDITTAAQVITKIGVACSECHTRAGHTPPYARVAMPKTSSGARIDMRLHPWAAARMWEGLSGPSSELWTLGATALASAPLHSDAILQCSSAATQIVAQARAVHDLGKAGKSATSSAARADVFARVVETCASCHHRVRAQPL